MVNSQADLQAALELLIQQYSEEAVFTEIRALFHRGPWRKDTLADFVAMARLLNSGTASGRWHAARTIGGIKAAAARLFRKFSEDETFYRSEARKQEAAEIYDRISEFIRSPEGNPDGVPILKLTGMLQKWPAGGRMHSKRWSKRHG